MLSNMFRAFAEFKGLTAILVAAIVLLVFVAIMASRAVRRHNAARDKILDKLKKEEALRRKYGRFAREDALAADAKELLHGVALRIQKQIENESDMTAAFTALPQEKQIVYALDFVLCEDAETLSAFFRLNGKPLTTAALEGARKAFDARHLELFEQGYRMFDPDDETTSVLPDDVKRLDADFAADEAALFAGIQNYIADNAVVLSE